VFSLAVLRKGDGGPLIGIKLTSPEPGLSISLGDMIGRIAPGAAKACSRVQAKLFIKGVREK
jgi:hypothetical protein